MATVTGLTAERMEAIEGASVVSGEIDENGHLILTTFDGGEIDAGYALVAIPDASTAQRGSVELATEAETAAHTDAVRAVTPAGLTSTIARIGVLETTTVDKVQMISAPSEVDPASVYPFGISVAYVGAGSGWSLNNGFGSITTVRQTTDRIYQSFVSSSGGSNPVNIWYRTSHSSGGWTPWARIANSSDPSSMGMTGEIRMFSAPTAPSGWRICDGAAISRTTYAALFAIIGTTYGAGNGTTTFNIPNFKGRTAVGGDAAQSEFNAMGLAGGAKTHTLSTAEMPTHTHTQQPHTHVMQGNGALTDGSVGTAYVVENGTFYGFRTDQPNETTAVNNNAGGGGAHNNLQPYLVVNYIICL